MRLKKEEWKHIKKVIRDSEGFILVASNVTKNNMIHRETVLDGDEGLALMGATCVIKESVEDEKD